MYLTPINYYTYLLILKVHNTILEYLCFRHIKYVIVKQNITLRINANLFNKNNVKYSLNVLFYTNTFFCDSISSPQD